MCLFFFLFLHSAGQNGIAALSLFFAAGLLLSRCFPHPFFRLFYHALIVCDSSGYTGDEEAVDFGNGLVHNKRWGGAEGLGCAFGDASHLTSRKQFAMGGCIVGEIHDCMVPGSGTASNWLCDEPSDVQCPGTIHLSSTCKGGRGQDKTGKAPRRKKKKKEATGVILKTGKLASDYTFIVVFVLFPPRMSISYFVLGLYFLHILSGGVPKIGLGRAGKSAANG